MHSIMQHSGNALADTNRMLGMQCLIMCRDAAVNRNLAQALAETGIAPKPIPDPDRALEIMAQERFDLVVVDCDQYDGALELLKHARRTPSNHKAALLAIATSLQRSREALQAGATMALPRPGSAQPARLALRTLLGNMVRERRRSFRIPVEIPISYSIDLEPVAQAIGINVSEDGMGIQSSQPLPANKSLSLRFVLPNSNIRVELQARVAWSDLQGRAGLSFLSIQAGVKGPFHTWLQTTFYRLMDDLKREAMGIDSGAHA